MKKIKLESKKLQFLKEKVVDLSNEELKSVNGGVSNWMCDTWAECTMGACVTQACGPGPVFLPTLPTLTGSVNCNTFTREV
ncbi:MAG: class IIb bacteriocin, lactobin A/cerein 7B family [Sphingobacteriia bacterium]|nr:class IIb bacteriocin, lactobin A/cerein 7B family [Sphingobacteriia bacterium]